MGAAICQGTFSFTGNDRALPPHEKGRQRYYRYLQYLQYLPVFKNARQTSVHAGFRENPKWQFLEPWVAISRTLGGNFSNLKWQFLELVENSNNCDINCTKILQTVIGFLFFGVQD